MNDLGSGHLGSCIEQWIINSTSFLTTRSGPFKDGSEFQTFLENIFSFSSNEILFISSMYVKKHKGEVTWG